MRSSKALKKGTSLIKRLTHGEEFWFDFKHKLLTPYRYLRNFFQNVKHTLKWFPVIWEDRSWDESFIFKLLAFKLAKVHFDLKNYSVSVHNPEDLAALKKATDICKRLASCDDYTYPYYKIHEKKWGKLKSKTTPAELDKDGKPLTYSWDCWRDKANTPARKKKERAETKLIYEKAEQDRINDINLLCEILKNNSRNWWD